METLQRTANRGSLSTGYDIDYSVKMESDNGERFQSSNLGTPTSVRTFTFSMWVKRTEIAAKAGQPYILQLQANTGISVQLQFAADSSTDSIYYLFQNSSVQAYGKTKAVFRDTSAWMHIVWRVDTTQSTATDRVRIYVNGVDQEIESGGGGHPAHPNQNYDVPLQTTQYLLGYDGGNNGFCGYAADYVYSDGQSLAPTEFGETDSDTGIWIPKDVSGTTFGNAGYYLDFADSSALGKDVGNSKGNFSHYGGAAIDQATDTPTNNFCTINALVDNNFSIWSLTEGGTRGPNTGENNASVGTFAVSSGKWYWEGVTTSFSGTNYWKWGVVRSDVQQGNSADPATDAGSSWYTGDNAYYTQTSTSASSVAYNTGFTGYTAGDIWSISLNCDVSPYTMTFRINNSVPGTSANNTDRSVGTFASSDSVVPFFMLASSSSDNTYHNFGNPFVSDLSGGNTDENGYGDFKYAPPSGYYALCTKNLAEYG